MEQQQWVILDQAMNPEQYTWLQERRKEEAKPKLNEEFNANIHEKSHKNPAVERCHIDRDEVMRILGEPVEDLNYNERYIRKLLHRFHDDPDRVKMENTMAEKLQEHHTDNLKSIRKARRVRQTDERSRTKDEQEWVSLDKIINPQARYKILQQPP